MTDVELDERVTALEEGGGTENGRGINAICNFTRQQILLQLK